MGGIYLLLLSKVYIAITVIKLASPSLAPGAIYTLDSKKDAFLVLFLRLTLSTMFGGNLSSFMYSAAGGILSFLVIL